MSNKRTGDTARVRHGRQPSTTHRELEHLGIELFTREGYAETSVARVAQEAGISRRTFFRYFPTKADVVWGDFAQEVARFREQLARIPETVPLMTALRAAVVEFNRVPDAEVERHRARLQLILGEPELIAHSMLRFADWAEAVAEFAARRQGRQGTELGPRVVADCALGAAVAAYRQWLVLEGPDRGSEELLELLDEAFGMLRHMQASTDPGWVRENRVKLTKSTWPEVEATARRILLLPTGSVEQHGPHLPLSTDSFIADHVARAVNAARPDSALAPVLAYGASGEHAAFPGTLSIGEHALQEVIVEFVRHAADTWPCVLVINGHGGNARALDQAREVCAYEGRSLAVHHVGMSRMDAHAGRAETSLMLHLEPSLVRQDLIAEGVTTPLRELMPRLRTMGVRAVSTSGVLGDPRGASGPEGALLFESLVARCLQFYDRAAARAGSWKG